MKYNSRSESIAWFQDHYKDNRLILQPPFQRKPVWTDKQRCALIESILMDVPIPEVYIQVSLTEEGVEQFGVVDGQQRLRTILQFIGIERGEDQEDSNDNSFALDSLPATSDYKGFTFADMADAARKRFFQYLLCVRMLYTEDTREIEDVFKRLNKYAMPLKAQELRNATFHGAFAILSEQLADDEYWAVNRIIRAASIRRMADIEMMSDLLIGLLHGPQGGSARVIDQYYEQYEQFDDEFPEQNRITRIFRNARAIIERLFPDIAETGRWGNRADYYSLFVAIGSLLETNSLARSQEKRLRNKLMGFGEEVTQRLENPATRTSAASQEYARAIEKGVNDKARRMDRHECLLEIMRPFFLKKKGIGRLRLTS